LHYVNDFWTLNRLIRMTSMCLDLWGQSYIFVERGRSGRGEPKELWWAKPTQVRVIPHPTNYISHYEYDPISGGQSLIFQPHETIRIYYPNPDDEFQPLSPLASSRLYADHDQASMHANLNLHRQGLQPGAVVYPSKGIQWTEEQAEELEDDINTRLGGYDRAHRWAVLRNEVTVDRGGVTPKDSEFLGGMEHDLMRVCNSYAWPIDLVAGKRTYENIDQALKQAWQTTAINGAFITAELAENLVPMFGQQTTVIPHFDSSQIPVMQEPETLRWEREHEQIDLVVTRNEWRRSRGMEPMEGGDKLWASEQTIPIDSPLVELPSGNMPAENAQTENGQVPEQELEAVSNGSER
jgi:HK97 family phage portal protein